MQLELSFRSETWLHQQLQARTGLQLALTVTDNARTIMSVRRDRLGLAAQVRLHHMFLHADDNVLDAVAAWVKRPKARTAAPTLDAFIRDNRHRMRRRAPRSVTVREQGAHVDLGRLFDEVNRDHFDNTITATITWGRRGNGSRRRQRSIRFGSYTSEGNIIRIHPALDQDFVPEFFVRYIVFHEMLHAHLGIDESENGRRRIHTREFNRIERLYPDYDRAIAWEKTPANMRRLLKK